MKGKRKRIVKAIRDAQKHGRKVNPTQLASCTGKIRYKTRNEANMAAEKVVNARGYKCRYCIFYHVGRKPWS